MKRVMATQAELKQAIEKDRVESVDIETVKIEGREMNIMSLEDTPGWKGVIEELQEEVENLEAQIFDINSEVSDEKIREFRIRRYYLVELINLPKTKRELFTMRKQEENK
jgi:hypothetical protein